MTPQESLAARLTALEGKACWHVNSGGAAGTTFSLALGGKVQRKVPLANPAVIGDFRQFEGEYGLYVWCSWRLEDEGEAIASSYQPVDDVSILKSLEGQVVRKVVIEPRSLDLNLDFNRSRLAIFCDHVVPASEHDCNWELAVGPHTIVAGPGFSYSVENQ